MIGLNLKNLFLRNCMCDGIVPWLECSSYGPLKSLKFIFFNKKCKMVGIVRQSFIIGPHGKMRKKNPQKLEI